MHTVPIKTIQIPCSHQPLHPYDIKIECKFQLQEFKRFISYCVDDGGQLSVEPITDYFLNRTGNVTDPFNPFCIDCYSHNISLIKSLGNTEESARIYLGELPKYIYNMLDNQSEIVDCCYKLNLPYYIDRFCDDEEELRALAERVSFEEEIPKPIPATKVSIEALSRSVIKNYETTNCAVCLEQLYDDNKKKRALKLTMPCKHEFHERCVVEWLRTSHICPLCRFELPTEEADEDY